MREQENLVNLTALLAQPKVLQAEAAKLQRSIAWEASKEEFYKLCKNATGIDY